MLFYHPDLTYPSIILSREESQHIIKVLRLKEGSILQITDGKGNLSQAFIRKADPKKCAVEITSNAFQEPDDYYIHIAISPTKNMERLGWFIEKAIELGIHEISFPICKNNIRQVVNMDKIEAKSISAMKQSLSAYLPKINDAVDFTEFMKVTSDSDQNFICHLANPQTSNLIESAKKKSRYIVLIGPEGDFREDEIELALSKGFKMVKMGAKRLRTETSALHACSILNAINY